MGLFVGSTPVKQVYVGSTPVKAVYVGDTLVWQDREVVQITLGSGFAARDQFRAALTARGLDFATVTELPFDINLTGSGDALHLFYGCNALTSVPPLNTINVTNMNGMFQECGSLVTVPPLDTRNVVYAPAMFAYCRSLTSVPTMNAVNMINVTDMFTGCIALTDGNVLLTNRNPAVNSAGMIAGSGLTREPWSTATSPVARKVTINSASAGQFVKSATGATGLIGGWPISLAELQGVSFTAPVTCDRTVQRIDTLANVSPGATIPAGRGVTPQYSATGTPYVFTEVL